MNNTEPRVLMVFDAMLIGGTETHVLTLTRSLLKRGIHVSICAGEGPLHREFAKLGCPLHVVPFFRPLSTKNSRSLQQQITDIIERDHITHMHVHQLRSADIALPVAHKRQLSVMATIHGKYYNRKTVQSMHALGASIIAVSPPIQAWLKQQGIASTLIPNGVSLKDFRPKHHGVSVLRQRLHLPPKADIVVYAGRLSWEKAPVCRSVITACHHLRKQGNHRLHLVIVGSGSHMRHLYAQAKRYEQELNSHFIHFVGAHKHMRPFYTLSNCVIGTGRVVLEAMACGMPVVAIGAAGLYGGVRPAQMQDAWQYYFGDHAGRYPQDSDRLERDIAHILASHSRQRRYGDAGRAFVERQFDSDRIAAEILALYRQAPASEH